MVNHPIKLHLSTNLDSLSIFSPGSGQAHKPMQTLSPLGWKEDCKGADYIYGQ